VTEFGFRVASDVTVVARRYRDFVVIERSFRIFAGVTVEYG
jgi:hypothetical protein